MLLICCRGTAVLPVSFVGINKGLGGLPSEPSGPLEWCVVGGVCDPNDGGSTVLG